MASARRLLVLVFLAVAACGGGDDGDGGDGNVDAPPAGDAPAACVLPAQTVSCTIGDDSPCTAVCGAAYCYNFSQLPTPVCSQNCAPGSVDQCPTGWTCNNMGRCRPPG